MPRNADVSAPAVLYTLRVHQLDGVTDASVAEFMSGLDCAYVMVKETEARRTHYQGWAVSALKDVTLRARLKKAFPAAVGNKGYSLKPAEDGAAYMRYCLKGTRDTPPQVVCRQGVQYTDEWLQNEWSEFWKHPKSEAYELKKAKQSVVEMIHGHFEVYKGPITPAYVTDVIMDAYIKANKPFDVFAIRRLLNVIMSKYDPRYRLQVRQMILEGVPAAYEPAEYTPAPIVDDI